MIRTLDEYQQRALSTDKTLGESSGRVTSLLGLAGEVGELLAEVKKGRRAGARYEVLDRRVEEELGDLLWYVASVASHYDLDLQQIASANIQKVTDLFGVPGDTSQLALPLWGDSLDNGFPASQQLPRRIVTTFVEEEGDPPVVKVVFHHGRAGEATPGDPLKDCHRTGDGYRYHDAFHLAHAAVLGWSPVLRGLLRRKRRKDRAVDDNEDGGRAQVIEEGVAAYVFAHADERGLFEGADRVDTTVLHVVRKMTSHLEVSRRSMGEWQFAILEGYKVFRLLLLNRGGVVHADLDHQRLTYEPPG